MYIYVMHWCTCSRTQWKTYTRIRMRSTSNDGRIICNDFNDRYISTMEPATCNSKLRAGPCRLLLLICLTARYAAFRSYTYHIALSSSVPHCPNGVSYGACGRPSPPASVKWICAVTSSSPCSYLTKEHVCAHKFPYAQESFSMG